jgi:hypothetical protein
MRVDGVAGNACRAYVLSELASYDVASETRQAFENGYAAAAGGADQAGLQDPGEPQRGEAVPVDQGRAWHTLPATSSNASWTLIYCVKRRSRTSFLESNDIL